MNQYPDHFDRDVAAPEQANRYVNVPPAVHRAVGLTDEARRGIARLEPEAAEDERELEQESALRVRARFPVRTKDFEQHQHTRRRERHAVGQEDDTMMVRAVSSKRSWKSSTSPAAAIVPPAPIRSPVKRSPT